MGNAKNLLILCIAATLILCVAAIVAHAGKEDMKDFNQQAIFETNHSPNMEPVTPWMPSSEQTQDTLKAIRAHLEDVKYIETSREYAGLEYIKENFEDYAVQFVGFEHEGQKKIWCNFAHTSSFYDDDKRKKWGKQVVMTMDGGKDYWQITYNVDTGEVSKLYINGES